MPSIKDIFAQKTSFNVLSSKNIGQLTSSKEVESFEYTEAYRHEKDRFLPATDYSHPREFAKYGSAQKYYADSLRRIYRMYPYDGSHKEKLEWHNSSSYLDNYIFDKEYPRTNGYLTIGYSWGTIASRLTASVDSFFLSDAPQYISVRGGPNKAATIDSLDDIRTQDFKTKSSKSTYISPAANFYDVDKKRSSNF